MPRTKCSQLELRILRDRSLRNVPQHENIEDSENCRETPGSNISINDSMNDNMAVDGETQLLEYQQEGDDDEYDDPDYETFVKTIKQSMDGTCQNQERSPDDANTPNLAGLNDKEIAVLMSALLARESNRDFIRRLYCIGNAQSAHKLYKIWKEQVCTTEEYYFCSNCSKTLKSAESCCGSSIKFIYANPVSQIKNILRSNFFAVRKLRESLRNGVEEKHNLASSFFRQLWTTERGNEMNLSICLSIDGVTPKGHTSSKLWPVSGIVLDLSLELMQKAKNVVLFGVIESERNPDTLVWDKIVRKIFTDLERTDAVFWVEGFRCTATIVTLQADQPAKRSFFGAVGATSSFGCFYCFSEETMYKTKKSMCRYVRSDVNPTLGLKAGGEILRFLRLYDTPIDVLHSCGLGFVDTFLGEMLPSKMSASSRKSDLFACDEVLLLKFISSIRIPDFYKSSVTCRTASDKIHFFRSSVFAAAICDNILSDLGCFVVIGVCLLLNTMFCDSKTSSGFFDQVAEATRMLLISKKTEYMTPKSHEFFFHIGYCTQKFGNLATISTSVFETFYKCLLGDYKTGMTTSFISIAARRFILQSETIREVDRRIIKGNPDPALIGIQQNTPNIWPEKKICLKSFKAPAVLKDSHAEFFAEIVVGEGKLKKGMLVFFDSRKVGEFVFGCRQDGMLQLFCRMYRVFGYDESFEWLKNKTKTMTKENEKWSKLILAHLKTVTCVANCQKLDELEVLPLESMSGIGVSILLVSGKYVCIQMSGISAHD